MFTKCCIFFQICHWSYFVWSYFVQRYKEFFKLDNNSPKSFQHFSSGGKNSSFGSFSVGVGVGKNQMCCLCGWLFVCCPTFWGFAFGRVSEHKVLFYY